MHALKSLSGITFSVGTLLHSHCLLQFPVESEPQFAFVFLFLQKTAAILPPPSPSALQQGGIFLAPSTEIKESFALWFPRRQN